MEKKDMLELLEPFEEEEDGSITLNGECYRLDCPQCGSELKNFGKRLACTKCQILWENRPHKIFYNLTGGGISLEIDPANQENQAH